MSTCPGAAAQELMQRMPLKVLSDERRVITLPFTPWSGQRINEVLERIHRMTDEEVRDTLASVFSGFSDRHQNLNSVFMENFDAVRGHVDKEATLSDERKLLIGSYFTMEYSLESCALFNPSIVVHPNQEGVPEGAVRFIMSLRATGEGHVSSIVFRSGMIGNDHEFQLDPPARFSSRTRLAPDQLYLKHLFRRKLSEMASNLANVDAILSVLPDTFTFAQLEAAIDTKRHNGRGLVRFGETIENMIWLARSNYRLKLDPSSDISHLIIFPQSENESHGIEDLRLVRLVEDDGSVMYYGTYTAYNGLRILPMFMETPDFKHIAIHTLNGACAQNKGMALFPRRINGHYVMCSRIDGQNLFIMFSDYPHFWESADLLTTPRYPWELMLMGNCGSPIETPEGWLLLTHGVGPMRRYCVGAMLLDLENPRRVLGRLRYPLLCPTEEEREGYVPNVVYSCGSLVHDGQLYVPYAMADRATALGKVCLKDLVQLLLDSPD